MPRGRDSRRVYDWAGFTFGLTTIVTTQAIYGSGLLDVEPVTLMRLRGEILVKGTPNAVADDAVIAFGFIVVSDNAFAAGGVSLPGPISDLDAPWVWHGFAPLSAGQTALDGSDIGSVVRMTIDSKAMRKLGINETLALVGQTTTNDYAAVSASGGVRALAMHS